MLNRGIGACSSSLFAACVERMVPPDTDLAVRLLRRHSSAGALPVCVLHGCVQHQRPPLQC